MKEMKAYIDSIDNKAINGWFINSEDPKKNKVLLYLDGKHKDTTRANIERQDVAEAHGQLLSGFYFDLTMYPLFNHIQLRSKKGDILYEVKVEHAKKVESDHQLPASSVSSSKDKKIYIDSVDRNSVNGWFINLLDPENNKVLLYLDGQYKAITEANTAREDVEETHGKLQSGFFFDLKKFPIFNQIELRSDDKEVLLKANIEHTENDDQSLLFTDPYSQERHRQLKQIKIDLSKTINGKNWYDIEPTGRWGGPELKSMLNIPALSIGKYKLEIAIENEFCGLEGLNITFNNNPVEILNTEYQTPVILRAEVLAKEDLNCWQLGFHYPKTSTPSSDSSEDQRQLGIFLASVTLTNIN
jgi:hypothetical protein